MTKIALIRRNKLDNSHVINSLRRTSHDVVDINHPRDLSVRFLAGDIYPSIFLAGYPINVFDILFYFGVPVSRSNQSGLSRNDMYLMQETEQAFLAGLWQISNSEDGTKQMIIINKGYVFSWNRALFSPSHKLRWLTGLGWCTGATSSYFDFQENRKILVRTPEPTSKNTYILLLSANSYFISPAPEEENLPHTLLHTLINKTQKALKSIALDWCAIPILINDQDIWAFGFSADVPANTGMQDLDILLKNVIQSVSVLKI